MKKVKIKIGHSHTPNKKVYYAGVNRPIDMDYSKVSGNWVNQSNNSFLKSIRNELLLAVIIVAASIYLIPLAVGA